MDEHHTPRVGFVFFRYDIKFYYCARTRNYNDVIVIIRIVLWLDDERYETRDRRRGWNVCGTRFFFFFILLFSPPVTCYIVSLTPKSDASKWHRQRRSRERTVTQRRDGGDGESVPRETHSRTGSRLTRVHGPRNICDGDESCAQMGRGETATILATRDACVP